MKNIIIHLSLSLFLMMVVSCGMSEKEKNEIAIITCNIIAESRNMDALLRIKEVNAAREKIGEEKFLETDEYIKTAYTYGLCKELVLNDPNFEDKLLESIEEETKRLTDLLNEEKEKRRQEEQAAKFRKIRRDSIQRIKDSLQNVKLLANRKKIDLAEKKFKFDIQQELIDFNPIIDNAQFDSELFRLYYDCSQIEGFKRKITLNLKNKGKVVINNDIGTCFNYNNVSSESTEIADGDIRDMFLNNKSLILKFINEVKIEIYGVSDKNPFGINTNLRSENYPPLDKNHTLKEPIIIKAKIVGN